MGIPTGTTVASTTLAPTSIAPTCAWSYPEVGPDANARTTSNSSIANSPFVMLPPNHPYPNLWFANAETVDSAVMIQMIQVANVTKTLAERTAKMRFDECQHMERQHLPQLSFQ